MHSTLMCSQSTHTTAHFSTIHTLRHFSRLSKKIRNRKGFRREDGLLRSTLYSCFPLSWFVTSKRNPVTAVTIVRIREIVEVTARFRSVEPCQIPTHSRCPTADLPIASLQDSEKRCSSPSNQSPQRRRASTLQPAHQLYNIQQPPKLHDQSHCHHRCFCTCWWHVEECACVLCVTLAC